MTKIGSFNNASSMIEEVAGNVYEQYEHKFEPIDNPYFDSKLPPQLTKVSKENLEIKTTTMTKGGSSTNNAPQTTIIENADVFQAKVKMLEKELIKEISEEVTEKCNDFLKEVGIFDKDNSRKKMEKALKKKKCNC